MILSLPLGLLSVDVVKTFSLTFSINKSSREAGEDFLGLLMACGLSVFVAVIFIRLYHPESVSGLRRDNRRLIGVP